MSKALESLFAACEELEASDVHVMAGRRACFRVRGALAPNGGFRELDVVETETLTLEEDLSNEMGRVRKGAAFLMPTQCRHQFEATTSIVP